MRVPALDVDVHAAESAAVVIADGFEPGSETGAPGSPEAVAVVRGCDVVGVEDKVAATVKHGQ